MKIVFATNNKHKLEEIKDILERSLKSFLWLRLAVTRISLRLEQHLEENARQKSSYVVEHYGQNCFADDTGLEVEALGGAPGVHSARYAEGTDHDSEANMRKLLANLEGKDNRKACFRTIISLIIDGVEHQFEGKVEGRIATEKHGTEGFGYDPIFIPEGYDKSFAELGEEIKNQISHRARAVKKLAEYLGRLKG